MLVMPTTVVFCMVLMSPKYLAVRPTLSARQRTVAPSQHVHVHCQRRRGRQNGANRPVLRLSRPHEHTNATLLHEQSAGNHTQHHTTRPARCPMMRRTLTLAMQRQ